MNEIKETLAILKTRWPEACLIIGLGLLPRLLNRFYFGPSIVGVGVFLLLTIISAGFLRTVYLEQNKQRTPLDLIQIGKHFFLRLFGFGIILSLAMMLFIVLLGRVVSLTNFHHVNQIGFTVITLVLAKLTLLIPAIIIVLDSRLSESFSLLWKVKLLKAKPLLIVFLIQTVVLPYLYLPLLLSSFYQAASATPLAFIISKLYSIVLAILALMVKVMAIRFVSSLNLDRKDNILPQIPDLFK